SVKKSTGDLRAYLATPSNGEATSATATARGETTQRPEFVLSENARKLLRRIDLTRKVWSGTPDSLAEPSTFLPQQTAIEKGTRSGAGDGASGCYETSSRCSCESRCLVCEIDFALARNDSD